MLEPGLRHRYFPQTYFPFTSPLDITDLQDRMYLRHESFALCSLHAHLPIPYEVNFTEGYDNLHDRAPGQATHSASAGEVSKREAGREPAIGLEYSLEGHETSKRPIFNLGIFERPNMLSLQGVEPGTIGMRNYLEMPVADGLVTRGREEHGGHDSDIGAGHTPAFDIDKTPATEAFKYLAHDEGISARIGKHAPAQNRGEILKGGPKLWKRVGVRGITMKAITERLERVSKLRDIVVEKGWRYTILDEYSAETLGTELFGQFLYPPSKSTIDVEGGESNLKVQIEALVKVLTTPGVWLDFSLPSERLLFAQNMHTREVKREDLQGISAQEKRRWGLIQLLLAVEMVIRLDAALRLGVAMHSKDLPVSNEEIRHFNQLRNLKVDWDLVMARRWLDLCYAKRMPPEIKNARADAGPQTPQQDSGRMGLFGRMKHSLSFRQDDMDDRENTDWDVAILPRQPRIMIDGLLRFAEDIGWSKANIDVIRQSFIKKLRDAPIEDKEAMLAKGVETVEHPHVPQHAMDRSVVELKQASDDTLGGPLSHAWLGGLIMPGYITCDLLMATLLEHDPDALMKLGSMAHIRSGFILDGRSYWSKTSVCGSVLAGMEGAKERTGWVSLPQGAGPVDEELDALGDGWRVISYQPVLKQREGDRIFDGESMAKESSPLGIGKGKVLSREFNMVTDKILDDATKTDGEVDVKNIELMLHRVEESKADEERYYANVSFQVSQAGGEAKQKRLSLKHGAHFISAHPCRPPHGHLGHASSASATTPGTVEMLDRAMGNLGVETDILSPVSTTSTSDTPASPAQPRPASQHGTSHPHKHDHLSHLPAHPLHKSFKYTPKSLAEVLSLGPNDWLPTPIDKEAGHVWIVDARGSWERDVVARAWCSWVGRDAIVSRVGKGCVGCAVREAKALEVGVIIRVGAVEG